MKRNIFLRSFLLFIFTSFLLTISGISFSAELGEPETTQEMISSNDLKAAMPPGEELKCTGGTKKTCVSEYAFVCPKGWSACPLSGGNKTCCKQN